jgi:hypothetical protein
MLVPAPVLDLNALLARHRVAFDESRCHKLIQGLVDIHVVVREQLGFQFPGPVKQTALTIGHSPESSKQ